jgi:hypothetical protein
MQLCLRKIKIILWFKYRQRWKFPTTTGRGGGGGGVTCPMTVSFLWYTTLCQWVIGYWRSFETSGSDNPLTQRHVIYSRTTAETSQLACHLFSPVDVTATFFFIFQERRHFNSILMHLIRRPNFIHNTTTCRKYVPSLSVYGQDNKLLVYWVPTEK